jgi:hypothetical protein
MIFLDFFLIFWTLNNKKHLVFKFKQLYLNLKKIWTNEIMPHRYRPSALVTSGTAVGIDPVDFNVGDTPTPDNR